MKLKKTFILREIADVWVVLPTAAETINFDGMLTLNTSGAYLWRLLENEVNKEDLIAGLMREYEVDSCTAETDIDEFIDKLRQAGCLEE